MLLGERGIMRSLEGWCRRIDVEESNKFVRYIRTF